MKIKEGFVTRKIGDKILAVAVGERSKQFNGMITLNETAQYIWKCLEKETTSQKVVEKVMKQYSIDEQTAVTAVEGFISELKQNELLDE